MNEIYLSTGAFTGRINNRDPHLLTRFHGELFCDGFEFMLMSSFDPILPEIIGEYRAEGIRIPILHARKELGDLLSTPEEAAFSAAKELFRKNCEVACGLGASRLVVHGWGVPDSDACPEMLYARIPALDEIAGEYGLAAVIENCVCTHGSPLRHLERLHAAAPALTFTVDTRCSEFHGELAATMQSPLWQDAIRHVHINDYIGGVKDWDARYPIYQPGKGQIDWELFFGGLAAHAYTGSITLEASAMLPDRVDCGTLNAGLGYIRTHLEKHMKNSAFGG
ncbi:MAG: sugar phosphate isomerase/epimerase [Clostridia bacterium]|nr:sugar phosphate isomerase/epimerase [Clostridia bacterium]